MADYINQNIAPKMGVQVKWIGPLSILRVARLLETGEADMSPLSAKVGDINLSHIVHYSDATTHLGRPHLIVAKDFDKRWSLL